VDRIGVEATGSDGAGLARWLRAHGQLGIEVDRPDRAARRRQGKADDLDATRPPGRCRPAPRPGSQGRRWHRGDDPVAAAGAPLGGQSPHQAANQLKALL
jgi:transposase